MDVRQMLAQAINAHGKGKIAVAERLYLGILQRSPGHVDALHLMGVIRNQQGRPEEALGLFQKAIKANPNVAAFHSNLGNAYMALGQTGAAEASFRKAIQLKPDFAEAHNNLGQSYMERKRYEDAEPLFRKAVDCRPDFPEAHDNLGIVLRELGRLGEAQVEYQRAIALRPSWVKPHDNLAQVFQQMGRIDEAVDACLSALKADARCVPAYGRLIQMNYALSDTQIETLAALATDNTLTREEQSRAHFSLGMLFDRQQQNAKAFDHYRSGNDLNARSFDMEGHEAWVRDIQKRFTPEVIQSALDQSESGMDGLPSPLFIIGMPRSGTTLVEQILSAHPLVLGAGELNDIGEMAQKSGYPFKHRIPKTQKLESLAQTYMDRTRALAGDSKPAYITNKMPANFLYLGLILLLFGRKARVIHVKRNPMDTCLSCYFQQFVNLDWSFDLAHIGRYYRAYESMMAHWRSFPIPMTEVVYEDLVAHSEHEIKRLIDACGLPWDDRCLSPERNERGVKTASVIQVRRPIHRQSLERWRAYEPWLGELRSALDQT